MRVQSFAAAAVLLVATALVGGCSLELPGRGEPPRVYVLSPKSTFPEDLPRVDWQLLIEVPNSPAGVNTARIALQDSPIELQYFQLANWADLAPKMVQTLLVESFENSGKIVAVGREAIGLRADYILKTDLREFQAEYAQRLSEAADGPPPTIRVRINAKLIQMPRRAIVASETFEHLEAAKSNNMDSIVGTFDEALGKVLKRIVTWTLTHGEANIERKPGT